MNVSHETVKIKDLVLLEKNARYMKEGTFRKLVRNIKRDGQLTSVPFCVRLDDGKFKVLSGNHRVMAAREAGIKEVLIMYTDEEMTDAEFISRQLSHNAITGEDDPNILRELYDDITDIDWREYSGLSDDVIDELEKYVGETINPVGVDFHYLSLLFVEYELDRLEEIFDSIQKELSGKDENIWLGRIEDYERLLLAVNETKNAYGVRNNAVALMLVLDVYEQHKEDLLKRCIDKKSKGISLSLIFDTMEVGSEVAEELDKAMQMMYSRGEIKKENKVEALEVLLRSYNNG